MDGARPAEIDVSDQLLEAMPDAVVVADMEGRVVRVNRRAEALSGYSRDALVGMPIEQLVPEALRPAHLEHRTAYQDAPAGRSMGSHLDIRFRRRDGSEFPADIALSPVTTDLGVLVVASVRDVTERTRAEAELRHAHDRLRAVVEVAQAALEGRPEAELLGLIARRARALVGSGVSVISLLDPGGQTMTIAATDGSASGATVGSRVPLAGSLTADVLASRRPVFVDDASEVAAWASGPALVVLLASGERAIGSLAVTDGRRFTAGDGELLELFAAQAAVAIGYTRVRDELQRFAVLEDRERIGRELHDGAIQALFAVGMGLQGMAMMTGDPVLQERLESTVGRIDDVIRDLRNYIFGLRPGLAADRHLARALRELTEELEAQHGVTCAVEIDQAVAARLASRAADIVQMTREALSNVGRHAAAATCRLSLRAVGGDAVLEVEDDGQGFEAGAESAGGWGLRNLAERAAAMGGSVEVESVPGEGTTVRLRVPV